MSRIYTVPFQGTLTNAGGDTELFYFKPAADKPIRLRGFRLSQFNRIGDSQEQDWRISIIWLPTTVTASSSGTAVTPVDVDRIANTTAGFTARCNDATVATTNGAAVILEEMAWNIRNTPCEFRWLDEREMPNCANASALVVRNQTTATADTSVGIVAWVEELA